jgi:hypothetical protein
MLSSRLASRMALVRVPLAGGMLLVAALAGRPAAAQGDPPNILPPPALAIDLLSNPNINHNLSGWTIIGDVTFDGSDDQGGEVGTSGCASAKEVPGQAADLVQCVNLPIFWRSVDLLLDYWTKAVTTNASSLAQIQYYSGQNCGGTFLSQVQQTNDFNSSSWQQIRMVGVTAPIAAQSASVAFRTLNPDPSTSATALLDSLFFGYDIVPGTCGADQSLLCVDDNRFQITAKFTKTCASGNGTSAAGVQDTADGGFLWCFDPGNPEVFVKVLNACVPSLGNTYWVFLTGLTNVGVTVTVTDTKTGHHRTYTNPDDTDFAPIFDTNPGLAVCP